jgi:hypothetical protein
MSPSTSLRLGPIACLIALSALGLAFIPTQQGAPARAEARLAKVSPTVYALLHVGKQYKHWSTEMYREDAYRKVTANMFHSPGIHGDALRESGIASLPIVKAQKNAISWLDKNLRTEYFDNTPILRVWLAVGTPDEQVAIVNAVIRAYLRSVEQNRKTVMRCLEVDKRNLADCIVWMHKREAELVALNDVVAENETQAKFYAHQRNFCAAQFAQLKEGTTTTAPLRIKEWEDRLRNMPRLLDWAAKPEPAE